MGRLSGGAGLVPLDQEVLRRRIADLYTAFTEVAPQDLHFPVGRELAERLGYAPDDLEGVPAGALAAFAGVGHHIDLAEIARGERVVDVGAGSGTDSLIAAARVGAQGAVIAVDATPAQAARARAAAAERGLENVSVRVGRAERLPVASEWAHLVVSNGVLNLVPDKAAALREIARVLRPGGRLAFSDVVSDRPIGARARCNAALWAECVAGAEPGHGLIAGLADAGLQVATIRHNPAYRFRPGRAGDAAERWGVRSVSIVAVRIRKRSE